MPVQRDFGSLLLTNAERTLNRRPVLVLDKSFQQDPFFSDAEEVALRNAGHFLPIQFLRGIVIRRGLLPMPLSLRIVIVQPPPAVPLK